VFTPRESYDDAEEILSQKHSNNLMRKTKVFQLLEKYLRQGNWNFVEIPATISRPLVMGLEIESICEEWPDTKQLRAGLWRFEQQVGASSPRIIAQKSASTILPNSMTFWKFPDKGPQGQRGNQSVRIRLSLLNCFYKHVC
jgi:hypothetical protein